jgi:hypothetical protein
MDANRTGYARRTTAALALLVAAGVAALGPARTGYAADDTPPDLPDSFSGCVGASPVVDTHVPWAQGLMAPGGVWPLTAGAGVLVAVVDTGVSASVPGLSGAVRHGVDVVRQGAADTDCQGRGTALAGIVAARPVAGSAIVGMAPKADILPVRITDVDGRIPPGALAAGIQAAITGGANVILVGTGVSTPDPALRQAIDTAAAHDVVVVASVASGRTGDPGQPTPAWYPAGFASVVAVGGVDRNGAPTQAVAPQAGLDLVAPAVDAVSLGPVGGGHYSVGGTAVAAAYVAGAAALVRAYHPHLTTAQVAQRLELTAQAPPAGRDSPTLGAGTVDPYAAVGELDPRATDTRVTGDPPPVALPAPPVPGVAAVIAGRYAAATAALAALILLVVAVLRRGHPRHWQP